MALSDCYMLRDVQTSQNEEILNVYFYQDLLLASTAENVVTAFIAGVLPKVRPIQTTVLHHVKVDAVNLADPANFYEEIIDLAGTNTGDPLPAHSAVNFSLRINSRALRPGSKRYCSIPEGAVDGNDINNSTYLALLETLRVQQSAILLSGVVATFQPIVIKRVPYTPTGSPMGHIAYRLPTTDAEFVFGNVVDALTSRRISHQVSRGNGR